MYWARGKVFEVSADTNKSKRIESGTHEILVMSPRNHDVLEPAVGRVHAVLGVVARVVEVGVVAKRVRVNNLLRRDLATNDEGISLNQKKRHQGQFVEFESQEEQGRDLRQRPTVHRIQRSRAACPGRAQGLSPASTRVCRLVAWPRQSVGDGRSELQKCRDRTRRQVCLERQSGWVLAWV